MTISLVARDPASGRFGVATADFSLAVGARVPRVGTDGAVAVQAGTPTTWAPVVMTALGSGVRAGDVVSLLRATPAARHAQLAVVDSFGGVAVLSGSSLEPETSEAARDGVCAAATSSERPGAARIAVLAYLTCPSGDFADRLLAGLSAADRMGGDVRGRQSAALLVSVRSSGTAGQPHPPGLDLRVDDARDPVGELRRLHRLWRAHALLAASRDEDGLYRDVDLALSALATAPADRACLGGAVLALLRADRLSEAAPLLRRLTALEPRTPSRIHRLIHSGLLTERTGRAALRLTTDDPTRTAPAGLPLLRPAQDRVIA